MRVIVHLTAVLDLDLDDWREDEDGDLRDPGDVPEHVAGQLAGFVDNELNNCAEFPASGGVEWTSVEVQA